jgi:hypothetical protein
LGSKLTLLFAVLFFDCQILVFLFHLESHLFLDHDHVKHPN